jgi:hypothetical protein
MSLEELRKYRIDSPEEIAYIGGAINRLGLAISTVAVFEQNWKVALSTQIIMWFGNELSGYFKLHEKKKQNDKRVVD